MKTDILQLAGLEGPVDLWRDAWGIPHLRARSAADAFFAMGHVHATDRLWQMDALRRRVKAHAAMGSVRFTRNHRPGSG